MTLVRYFDSLDGLMEIGRFECKTFTFFILSVPEQIVVKVEDCRGVGDYNFLRFE